MEFRRNYLLLKASNEETELLVKVMTSSSCVILWVQYQDNFKITAFPPRLKSTVQEDCQISPIPEQIFLSLLSFRFHCFSLSDQMNYQSIIIFAEQKMPSQCIMDRFAKEPSLGFNEQR